MNMIAVECSTEICSVASFQDNILVNLIETEEAHSHSRNLPLMIQTIIRDFDDSNPIDAFAISVGPGSFSSLRISMSLIKGLVFGTDIDIFGVPTLDSLNLSLRNNKEHYIISDSYRDKCFIQKFNGKEPCDSPYIELLENLKKMNFEVFGFSKSLKESQKIIPSSILIGEYAIKNRKELLNNEINPIYLSENKYVKINDSGSK